MQNDNETMQAKTTDSKPVTQGGKTTAHHTFENLKKTVQYQIIKAFNSHVQKLNVGQVAKANGCESKHTVSSTTIQRVLNETNSSRVEVDNFTLMENGINKVKLTFDGKPRDLMSSTPMMNTLIQSSPPLKKAVRALVGTLDLIAERNKALNRRDCDMMPLSELLEAGFIEPSTVPVSVDSLTELPNFIIDASELLSEIKAQYTGEVVGESFRTVQGFKMTIPEVDERGFMTLNRETALEFAKNSFYVTTWYCPSCQESCGDNQLRHSSGRRRACPRCASNGIRASQLTAQMPIIDNHTGFIQTVERVGQGKVAVKRGQTAIDFKSFKVGKAHINAITDLIGGRIDADQFMEIMYDTPVKIRSHGGRTWVQADVIPCTYEAYCEGKFRIVVGSILKMRFKDE